MKINKIQRSIAPRYTIKNNAQNPIRIDGTNFAFKGIDAYNSTGFAAKDSISSSISQVFKTDRMVLGEIGINSVQEKSPLFKKYMGKQTGEVFTQNDFNSNINNDPYRLRAENAERSFILINDYLSNTSNSNYGKMLDLLGDLSEAIYNNDKTGVTRSWGAVIQTIKPYWQNVYSPRVLQQENQKENTLHKFLGSSFAQKSNNLALVDEVFNSEAYSLDEKYFLVEKLSEPHGYDLCNFLISQPPSNTIRKQIIENVMMAEEFADENYSELKELFANDISKGDTSSAVINQQVQNRPLIDLIIRQTQAASEIGFMEMPDKVNYLKDLPRKDLITLLENCRKDWILTKSIEAYETETLKYDLSTRFDEVTLSIVAKATETMGAINQGTDKILGQGAKIENMQIGTLETMVANDKNLRAQLNAMSQQSVAIFKLLSENTMEARVFQAQIMKGLDYIAREMPHKSKEVREARTLLQKLKDGIINPGNLVPLAITAGTIPKLISVWKATEAGAAAGTLVGGPVGTVIGAAAGALVVPLAIFTTNLIRSFSHD